MSHYRSKYGFKCQFMLKHKHKSITDFLNFSNLTFSSTTNTPSPPQHRDAGSSNICSLAGV